MSLQLTDLSPGEEARITSLREAPEKHRELARLGLIEGAEIVFLRMAPLGDPVEIRLGNTRLSLRRKECEGIQLERISS